MSHRRRAALGLVAALLLLPVATYAVDLMREVKARLADAPLLRGHFQQQKSVAGFKTRLSSSGEFLLWRDRGVLWHTRKPVDSTLVLTRDTLTVQSGSSGRTVGAPLDASHEPALRAMNELMFALLTADVPALQARFRVEGELVGSEGWKLALTPTEAGLSRVLRRVMLEGDRHVRHARIEEANGDVTEILFDQMGDAPPASAEEARRLGG